MKYFVIILFLFSSTEFKNKPACIEINKIYFYSGGMREISHPETLLYQKAAKESSCSKKIYPGITEILLTDSKGDSTEYWFALDKTLKSLPKKINVEYLVHGYEVIKDSHKYYFVLSMSPQK